MAAEAELLRRSPKSELSLLVPEPEPEPEDETDECCQSFLLPN